MANTGRAIFLLLLFLVGGCVLQEILSRSAHRWPGLILPILTFLYSLLMIGSLAAYQGRIPWGAAAAAGLLGNIPTAILLAIYAVCRERLHKRSELEKMHLDDL